MKSGSLNLLEHSGPVQACNGIAFTTLDIFVYVDKALDLKFCLYYQVWLLNNEATRPVHFLSQLIAKTDE